ncbi:hypothetical protein DFH08DRAFT_210816 [Mycena albidolilacea]|uniref:Uncharacterized protein n=1 Tax=Mycena albidolilacea TaxID=1033008 RepID=A0AAD6ZZQ3_9AGAR|nr:hypothetical protein DFH08DRAFT_210816 [Mycena albidolilacea]
MASESFQAALSLAIPAGNIEQQFDALYNLVWVKWILGDSLGAQSLLFRTRELARMSADLYKEASALRMEAVCWMPLGNFNQSLLHCDRARELLALCDMSGGRMYYATLTTQAEVHRYKTEYVEAHKIYSQILQEVSVEQDAYVYAWCLLWIAEIEVATGASHDDVQRKIDAAKSNFMGDVRPQELCNILQAALDARDATREHILPVRMALQKLSRSLWGKDRPILGYCLEILCVINCQDISLCTSATVFLAHSTKYKVRAGINRALYFLADAFLNQSDENTATSLLTVALEGFMAMDIHQCRAECMLRLGDISKAQHDIVKAVQLWKTARPLFERSLQKTQVKCIDERLDSINGHSEEL